MKRILRLTVTYFHFELKPSTRGHTSPDVRSCATYHRLVVTPIPLCERRSYCFGSGLRRDSALADSAMCRWTSTGTSVQPVHPSSRIAQPAFQILVMWWILSPSNVMT